MTVEEALRNEILTRFKSVRQFSIQSGLPYATIDSVLKRGVMNSGLNTMIKICEMLSISLDGIARGEIEYKAPNGLVLFKDALMVAESFDRLDPQGQTIIKALLDMEAGRTEAIRAQIWREVEERGYKIEAAREEQAEA